MKCPKLVLLGMCVLALAPVPLRAADAPLLGDTFTDSSASGSPVPRNTIYGAATTLQVYKNAGGHTKRTLMKFDVLSLPGTDPNDVTQAWLQLCVYKVTSLPAGTIFRLSRLTSAWDEKTLKDNFPASSTLHYPTQAVDNSNPNLPAYVDFELAANAADRYSYIADIAPWVQDWMAHPAQNFGVILEVMNPAVTATVDISFYSSEFSGIYRPPLLQVETVPVRIRPRGDVLMGAFTKVPAGITPP